MNNGTADVEDVGTVKRKRAAPTTQLTLRHFRALGYECDVCERYNAYSQRKNDLFGFADIAAVGHEKLLLIQTTSRSNLSARRKKIKETPAAALCARVPGVQVMLVGWYKAGNRWTCTVETIGPEFAEESCEAGFICRNCAVLAGGTWPHGHVATTHSGVCPQCGQTRGLVSIDDYNWPNGSNKPGPGNGRD